LDTLELNKNKLLTFFPNVNLSFTYLDNLTYLSLNGNGLTHVPPICKRLPKLKQLHLHMNRLTDLAELCRPAFANLQVLDVGNNKIRELPVAFVHFLSNLGNLCIVNNDLASLPPLMGFHKTLSSLQVDGNPLKSVRRQIIEKGTPAILLHLREKYV
jgi:Leucine-rich repeat (LRR) protein